MVLLFVSIACANMLIPSYAAIQQEFGIPEAYLAIPDAFFVLISACFALAWGYFADRIDRIKVLLAGAFSWTFGMLLTFFSISYEMLLLSRAISGAGLGCVLPIGYSLISDAIPADERSGWFGWLAILSSVSNASGQALSSFLGPLTSWRFPFLILSGMSFVIIIILFFAKIPNRGASEDELLELSDYNLEYSYRISMDDLAVITKKKTNRNLIIQGFFSIIPGTILVYFLTSTINIMFFKYLPNEIRLQTSTIFAGMVGIGYILGSIILSYLGDVLFRKNKKNRARLATFCMFLAIPLALIMFFSLQVVDVNKLGITYPTPIPPEEVGRYMISTIVQIFVAYPNYVVCFFFALFASMLSAGPVANRNAVMVDVNMPEHKGTAASFFNLSEQLGKGMTLLLSSLLISMFGNMYWMMVFSVLLWIPAGVLWFRASKTVVEEMDKKSTTLSERKQLTLIDHVFELEFQMDKAIQKVQDSKFYIETEEGKFLQLLEDALKIFKFCEREGGSRSITNIEKKALGMRTRVVTVRNDAKKIYKELKKEKLTAKEIDDLTEGLRNIAERISIWGQSTFGELQTYFEDAYLKIIEAKLLRNRDLIRSMSKINEAIIIYHRVKHLLQERLGETEDLKEEEKLMNDKERALFEKCSKSLDATVKLREEIESIFKQLSQKGILKEDLMKISELTLEYSVNLYKIMEDTFGTDNKTKKAIQDILKKIDEIFENYDQLKEDDFTVF